jgi:hypothetical protein
VLELPTPSCPACLFVFARELLPAFGPIAASSSFTCHRLTRMATNKDAFLKLQGEAQKADQESLRRPRLTDFGSPHHVRATSTFQPTFSLAAPDPFQVGLSFCQGYGPCPASSLGLPPHCRRRLAMVSSGLPRGGQRCGISPMVQQVTGFLYCSVLFGLLYGVTGLPSWRYFTPMARDFPQV